MIEALFQHLAPAVRQIASRNRTARGESSRLENEGLKEIDKEATTEGYKQMDQNDLMILDTTRTGCVWTRDKAFKAGQIDDPVRTLCGRRSKT